MPPSTLTVMVVDDNEDNRDLLSDILCDDYQIICAEDGLKCVELAPSSQPDIILLDVNMPNMDGYEACRKLKANPQTALIPVVFVTALTSPEQQLEGYEAGAEDYITKPYIDEIIIEVVTRVIERQKQFRDFESQHKEAMSTAFQAMANSAEPGYSVFTNQF